MSENTHAAPELDARGLIAYMCRKVCWIALAAILGGAFAFLGTKLWITPQYRSSAKLYIANSQRGNPSGAVSLEEIQASRELAATFVEALPRSSVMEPLGEHLAAEFSPERLAAAFPATDGGRPTPETLWEAVEMKVVEKTEVVEIWVKTPDAQLSARICTLLTEQAPAFLASVVKGGAATTIQEAAVPTTPFSPSIKRNCALGLLAGALLSGFFFLLRYALYEGIERGKDHNIACGENPSAKTGGATSAWGNRTSREERKD